MKSRQEIKALAKAAMKEQRGTAILLLFVYSLVASVLVGLDVAVILMSGGQGLAYWVVYWIGMAILYVMAVNYAGEFIKIYKKEDASVGAMFSGFSINFARKLGGMLWMTLWLFLWSLLLVIPGIIKALAYFFAPYILADCPGVSATEALKISMRITKGYKMDIFVFSLTWIGWLLLSGLTFGILYIVYVGPYMETSYSGLYLEMKNKALAEGRITHEELGISR